jgi:hypothetical protein
MPITGPEILLYEKQENYRNLNNKFPVAAYLDVRPHLTAC